MHRQAGQVLVFVALVLPIVLLPAAAYAVDAATAAAAQARLDEASVSAAESAVQAIDHGAFRASAMVRLDQTVVDAAVRDAVTIEEPRATVDQVTISGLYVSVRTSELVTMPFNFLGTPSVRLRASASARLALGYDSLSSFFPFSVSTF